MDIVHRSLLKGFSEAAKVAFLKAEDRKILWHYETVSNTVQSEMRVKLL